MRTGPLFVLSIYSGLKKPRSSGLVVKVNSDNLVIFVASDLLAGFSGDGSGLGSLGSYSVGTYSEYLILKFYIPSRVSMRFSKVLRRRVIG